MANTYPKNVFLPAKGGKGVGNAAPVLSPSFNPRNSSTLSQYLARQKANDAKPTGDFVSRIKADAGGVLRGIEHPVSWTFDKLLRPMYAVEQGIDTGVKGGSFGQALHMAKKGFEGQQMSGSQILSDAGLLHGHGILRGIAGLGIDIATDPLTYLTGGTDVALQGTEHAALVKAGDIALNTSVDAAKGDKAAIDGLKMAADQLSHGGQGYYHRAALAALKARAAETGGTITGDLNKSIAAIGQSALKERNSVEKLLPKFRANIPFTPAKVDITPTSIKGHVIVPALPKLSNVAKLPGPIGKAAASWQDKFIVPKGETAASHTTQIMHRHIYETEVNHMMQAASDRLGNVGLSAERQAGVLHHFEVPKYGMKAVIANRGSFQLNPAYINKLHAAGLITPEEEKFVRAYHGVTQDLFKGDKAVGVHYKNLGEQGKLYVPHKVQMNFDASGLPNFAQRNWLTEAGFQKKRSGQDVSLHNLAQMQAKGSFGAGVKVETDPLNALYARIRQGGMKRADANLTNAFASTIGKTTRYVNEKALNDVRSQLAEARAARDIHYRGQTKALADAAQAEQAFKEAHAHAFADAASEQEAKMRKILYGRTNKAKAMNLGRARSKLASMQAQHAGELHQIEKGTFDPLNQHIGEHVATSDVHNEAIKSLNTEIKTLSKTEKETLKGKGARIPHDWVETNAVDKFGHKIALPSEVANSVQRYQKLVSGDSSSVKDFMQGYQKLLSNWKIAVTSINPGYRIRYSLANYVAMWVKGMNVHDIGIYSLKAANMIKKAKNGDATAMRELDRINSAGGLFGVFRGDVNTGGAALRWGGSTPRGLLSRGKPFSAAAKATQNFTIYFDNLDHLSFFLWNHARGMPFERAIAETKSAMFDYTHLTPFEQKAMKNVAPFYTWMRKNVPFQLKQFAENPGRQAAYAKAGMESSQSAGGDKGNLIPDYLANDLSFQVPFGPHDYYTTSAGITDLRMFESKQGAWERTLSSVNPAIKFPMELALNKNAFTGQNISDPTTHSYAPVSNAGEDLMKVLHAFHVPGASYGQTARTGPGGARVTGPGANPYWQYLMQQTPLSNLLLVNGPGSIKRTTRGVPPETSELGGMTITHVDPTVQKEIASINLQNEVKAEIAKLRDKGIIAPAKRPNSKKQNLIDQILFNNTGKR